MDFEFTEDFEVEDLGVQTLDVYDIEVDKVHNFFANDILVHNSNYYSLSHLHAVFADGTPVLEFCYIIESHIEDFFDKILKEFAESKDMPHIIDFKRECIFDTMIILAKKKYLMNIRQKEAELYAKPKLKITGFEIKKSSTPKFSKLRVEAIIKNIFEKDNYDENLQMVRDAWKEYKNQPLDMIAQIGGVNEYTKYAKPTEWYLNNGLSYMPRTPARNRASINHNYLVRKMNLPVAEISNGSKVKYVAVYPTNPIRQDIIAWSGNWPKQFDELGFKIDYEKQFEDTFTKVLERVYSVIGWGKKIVYKPTAFSKFAKKTKEPV